MQIPILFNISVLLDVQDNLPETSPFLTAKMALVSTFFQMFMVLGMYNFGVQINSPNVFVEIFQCVSVALDSVPHDRMQSLM